MSTIKVIGIGSPFSNDSLGWQVINELKQQDRQHPIWPEQVELIETDRPGINLIQMLQDTQFVILIDAIHDESRHGEVIRLEKNQLSHSLNSISSHNLDVASAIALAEKLKLLPKMLVIIGLGVNPKQNQLFQASDIQKLTDAVIRELATCIPQSSVC